MDITNRLYLSGTDEKACILARRYGLGYECAAFSWAPMLENSQIIERERKRVQSVSRCWFHAPFAELTPAAIDPLIREVTVRRYRQAVDMAVSLGISRIVIHCGFIPQVYYPEWFTEQAVRFWGELLPELSWEIRIALENVMEPDPSLLTEIVRQVNDPRLGLCFDIGHAKANRTEFTIPQWIERMSPWLMHTHIHNNDGKTDLHAPLGEGVIDMNEALSLLAPTGCTFTIENQNSEPSLKWLADNGWISI